ncbi:VOC family protein [Gilvibacter sediminis]|uniref:VOC family protein n=1 Tax=Gilvibacter sediminis TaxID=379071 RepID=UPI00235061F5|nr:VOC family protein [Gilvibacter sediminis]MDC7998740.1 VOC family protein [Gilvibacter sediminis]
MNLNQVTVPTNNMDASVAFYKLLGLNLIVDAAPRYVRFECPDGDSTFSIHQIDEMGAGEAPVVYFETQSLNAEVDRLQQSGIIFDLLPTDQSWGWREARLTDPAGNKIILFWGGEHRKNPPWRVK